MTKFPSEDPQKFLKDLEIPSILPNIQKLNKELVHLFISLQPYDSEINIKNKYIDILRKKLEPDYNFYIYGSFSYDTSLYDSDIDIMLISKKDICENLKNLDLQVRSKLTIKKIKRKINRLKFEKKEKECECLKVLKKLEQNEDNLNLDENMKKISAFYENSNNEINKIDKEIDELNKKINVKDKSIDKEELKNVKIKNLYKIKEKLKEIDFIDKKSLTLIETAKVPILKFTESLNRISFDISIDEDFSLEQTKFINEKMEENIMIKPMCYILKHFLKIRSLNNAFSGGLSSYAQFLMIYHFCNIHPVFQKIGGFKNFAVAFMDFFHFFGYDFNYEKAAIDIKKLCFTKNYSEKSFLVIIDPISGKNVTKYCNLMNDIKNVFSHCYKIMSIALNKKIDPKKSLLSLWLDDCQNDQSIRKSINTRINQT